MDGAAITESLEQLAESAGDPTGLVYDRLFAESPQLEALFIRDVTGSVRGQMLSVVFDTLLDFVGRGAYARGLILSELVNHEALGVPVGEFGSFFRIVRDIARETLAGDWTPAMEAAWADLLAGLDGEIARQAALSGIG
jgi:hypothetical protein